ncbi:MAG: hypothetical protein II480_04060 [Bacteroidales bacterium]|nr:hypothetical protein [Bacteroidales bacterium]
MWPFDIFKRKEQDTDGANERNLKRVAKRLRYGTYQLQYHYDYVTGYRDWSNHIYNTRKFISDCARRCFGRRSCVVLGSGFCLDVPVLELSRMFDNVFLVDINHPQRVMQRIHETKNVQLVTEDITKIAAEALNSINHYKDFSVDMLIHSPNYSSANYSDTLGTFDFVISVNTLSFLAEPINAYLSRLKLVDDIAATTLQTFVQQYHINMLPKGKSCIISPISQRYYNADGLQMYDHSIAYIPASVIRDPQTWTWNYSNDHTGRIEYSVKAWEY